MKRLLLVLFLSACSSRESTTSSGDVAASAKPTVAASSAPRGADAARAFKAKQVALFGTGPLTNLRPDPILDAFLGDQADARAKYLDQPVALGGVIEQVERDGDQVVALVIARGEPTPSDPRKLRLELDRSDGYSAHYAAKAKPGSHTLAACTKGGSVDGERVTLVGCSLATDGLLDERPGARPPSQTP